MESLKEIVKKNLEELKSRNDAEYFQNTIKALQEILERIDQDEKEEARRKAEFNPIETLIRFNFLILRCLKAGALLKKDSPFNNVAASGNRRAPEKKALQLLKAPDLEK